MSELIRKALADADETKVAIVDEGALAQSAAVFQQLFDGRTAIVVGDERTMEVAGNAVQQSLREAGIATLEPHVFPGEPELYARYENCEALRDVLAEHEATPVAVGAGTLNDIVKRAAGELERGYMVVGTAASMDGYTAFGSSIALDGFKQTLSCPAPQACISDLTVMASAPQVMTASGYGDLLGKVPAGADWMIADALEIERISDTVWELVQGPLRGALARPDALAEGDVDATGELAEGLVMSGLAMQAFKSSRPASGAEHQFSHLWEMEGHGVDITPRRLSHGFKVGLGSVAIAAIYELLLAVDMENLDIDAALADWPSREKMEETVRAAHPDPQLVEETVVQALAKWIPAEELRDRLERVVELWPVLRKTLKQQLMPAAQLQQMLRAVGAPAHPEDIDLEWDRFRETYTRAQMIRKRYTVLDLLLEANLLHGFVDQLFAPEGFWGSQRP